MTNKFYNKTNKSPELNAESKKVISKGPGDHDLLLTRYYFTVPDRRFNQLSHGAIQQVLHSNTKGEKKRVFFYRAIK